MAGRRKDPLERALAALQRRERSVAELRRWLEARGHEAGEIEAALGELIELGALDDERYARLFAEDKRELAGWGPARIEAALRERGVDPEQIGRALAGDDHEAQVERAAALLAERGMAGGDDRERSRALGLLTRRGFGYEVAHAAIRAAERAAAEAA